MNLVIGDWPQPWIVWLGSRCDENLFNGLTDEGCQRNVFTLEKPMRAIGKKWPFKFFPRWSLNYLVQSFQKLVKLPCLNITTFYWSLILRSRLKISNFKADVKLSLIQELGYPIHIYVFNFFSFHFIFMIKYPTFVQLIYKANVKAVSFCS